MIRSKIKFSLVLLLIVMVVIVGGCSNGIQDMTDGNDIEEQVTNEGKLPLKDSKLAEHAPRQVIVKANDNKSLNNKLNELNARVESEIEEMNVKKIVLPKDKSIVETMRELKEVEGVEYVNPNYRRYKMSSFTGDRPDDPRYDQLWGLEAIKAPEAWETTIGSSDVVVAVIDTGVQKDHPDLKNKVLDGFNVYEENSNTEDEYGHGTHVAGIAAGLGNNNKGIAGVSWESPVLPIRVFQPGYDAYSFEIAEGINWLTEWAQEHNSKRIVANMSLGGSAVCKAEKEAIDRAIDEGIVFSVSMGNDSRRTVKYPANYNGVIAVGATNGNDEKSSFSTEGDWISVAAPGSDILSSVPGNEWSLMSGTSMAAPYVTGTAALVLAENPNYTPDEVKSVLEKTAQDLGETGFDEKFGHGLVDAASALDGSPSETSKFTIEVVTEDDIDNDGELEDVEIPGADVVLKDSNGDFVADEVTDNGGQAVFNMIEPGTYDVEVNYSKRQPNYEYGSKIVKDVTVENNEESIKVTLNGGVVTTIDIITNIAGNNYVFQDKNVKVDVLDAENNLIFTDIETNSKNILLNTGEYSLRVSDYEEDYAFDFEEGTSFTVNKNEETTIEINTIPAGIFSIDFTFQNEEGNNVEADDIEVILVNQNGEKVYKQETSGSPTIEELVSPGDYTLKVTATVEDPDWAQSDKVGYREISVKVTDGDLTERTVSMTLK